MTPRIGPSLYKVVPISDTIIAPAGATLGPKEFQFPRSVFVTHLLVTPTSGLRVDMAGLKIQLQDETFQDVFFDSRGGHTATVLSTMGVAPLFALDTDLVLVKWLALQRPVMSGDSWYFTLTNVGPNPTAAEVLIAFEEGEKP